MRNLLVLVVVCVATGSVLAEKSVPTGHVSNDGKYSVVFPSKPKTTDDEKTVATAGGNLTVVTTRCEASGVVYSVTYTDYPESFKDVSASRILDGVVTGMKGDAKDSSSTDIAEGEVNGRMVSVYAGENAVRAKVLLSGRRLYLVQVSGKKKAVAGEATERFLSSFVLAK